MHHAQGARDAGYFTAREIFRVLMFTLAITMASFVTPGGGPLVQRANAASDDGGPFRVIAHRGHHLNRHTENTIPAFNAARRAGLKVVEADMALTSDRQWVMMHDTTLERTTRCHGPVAERTLAASQQKCHGRRKGEFIPTMARTLR